ncbi:MAG: GGDEF domain-containing protein [Candidatus Hydrogenedentes bacterium]|nr:GGDEF domain-containing protein [Candidatus Hydrogenedentota bacterium]
MTDSDQSDPRLKEYKEYVLAMQRLEFGDRNFDGGDGPLGELGTALVDLSRVMERRYHELARLLEIAERVNHGVFIGEVMDHIYDSFRPIIPFDRIGLALLEEDGAVLRSHWARSDSSDVKIAIGYAQNIEHSSLQQILQSGKPRLLNDLESYCRENPCSESSRLAYAEGIRSSLTCPLVAMGKPVGFLFFSSRKPHTYANLHQDLFLRIATQLSVILEKSRLYEELYQLNAELREARNALEHQATHDVLTGLWNRGTILEILDKELARSQRAGHPAAALMIDIDHFKQVNDRHGHLAGDEVLREVSRRLAEVVRKGDALGRYGGEEFLVVLAMDNIAEAETAVDRLRRSIAAVPVTAGNEALSVSVSVGMGIVKSGEYATGETLLRLADEALYAAKASGRNRVVVHAR